MEPDANEAPGSAPDRWFVYVGTYTGRGSEGIYRLRFDASTGELERAGVTSGVENPSFLALHPNGHFLYAAEETNAWQGQRTGSVSAFAVDDATGELRFLGRGASGGGAPCHVSVSPDGSQLLVANYGGGSVCAYDLGADGNLGTERVFQHEGKSVDPRRQEGPHAHWVGYSPGGRFAMACDLGLDQVLIYRLAPRIHPAVVPFARVRPAAGPRHAAWSLRGDRLYVINEMASTITTFLFDAESGLIGEMGSISTLPSDFDGSSSTAEIAVHPTRGFVYGSNRGHDSIAVFAPDPEKNGALELVEHESTGGRTPRSFGIEPGGRFLLAANQDSSSIVVFRIDSATGALEPTGKSVAVPTPVCVVFRARGEASGEE